MPVILPEPTEVVTQDMALLQVEEDMTVILAQGILIIEVLRVPDLTVVILPVLEAEVLQELIEVPVAKEEVEAITGVHQVEAEAQEFVHLVEAEVLVEVEVLVDPEEVVNLG